MPIPPHRAGIIAILTTAGFRNREDHLPLYSAGGTFSVTGSAGVLVTVEWWSATDAEIAARVAEIADVLRDEGLQVEEREREGRRYLYVPQVLT